MWKNMYFYIENWEKTILNLFPAMEIYFSDTLHIIDVIQFIQASRWHDYWPTVKYHVDPYVNILCNIDSIIDDHVCSDFNARSNIFQSSRDGTNSPRFTTIPRHRGSIIQKNVFLIFFNDINNDPIKYVNRVD